MAENGRATRAVDRPRCRAVSASTGKRCKNRSKTGENRCSAHSPKSEIGAPSKIRDERIVSRIKLLVEAGTTRTQAAREVGIHRATLASWLEQGESDFLAGRETAFSAFFDMIEQAEGRAFNQAMVEIRKAMGKGEWRAATAWLDRRYPAELGKGESGGRGDDKPSPSPFKTAADPTKLPVDERRQLVALLRKAQRDETPTNP